MDAAAFVPSEDEDSLEVSKINPDAEYSKTPITKEAKQRMMDHTFIKKNGISLN